MSTTEALSAEVARLREVHEAARLKCEIRHLQAAAGQPLVEDFGDVVDRREYLHDDPSFGSPLLPPFAALSDRQEGKLWPIYQCEQDLARIRARAHNLALLTGTSTGVLDALANYILGQGFTFTVQPLVAEAAPLASAVQATIDRFFDDNAFCGALDREAHHRSREDGEAFLALHPAPNGTVKARFLECEQITQPADPRPLEDWLGCGEEFPSCWKFGIHTSARETDGALGYHAVYDAAGRDWDYIPAARMEHIKRNVPANAKRGVSDFFPVLGDLEREAKLRRNTADGAALQAAIAWVVEVPTGTLASAAAGTATGNPIDACERSLLYGGLKLKNVGHFPAGTILRPSAGLSYKPGPMGSERNRNFVLVAQYILRAIAVRWNMPEYLISADASNANYASSLVAESPFVKAREADQQFFRRHFHSLLWKVVRLAWEAGRFARLGASWETLESLLEIKIDAPAVATRDPLKLAQTQEKQIDLGLMSRRPGRPRLRRGSRPRGRPAELPRCAREPPRSGASLPSFARGGRGGRVKWFAEYTMSLKC
jgi:hypothetical protein